MPVSALSVMEHCLTIRADDCIQRLAPYGTKASVLSPPYRMVTPSNWLSVLPCAKINPPQSPGLGALALPLPLLSPPTVSSRYDVKIIGAAAVPIAFNVPGHVQAGRERIAAITT